MILTKMVINTVAGKLAKHFKLDKIMTYVFEDNELDKKTKNLEDRIIILESLIAKERKNG
tara:strand:- start:927 stop:1106 length:180 start_codon:yes stop_codon:yes gene_type:complete